MYELTPYLDDVASAKSVINSDLASRAALCAQRIHNSRGELSFTEKLDLERTKVWLPSKGEPWMVNIAISPLERIRSRSFFQATRTLCRYAGIPMPETATLVYTKAGQVLDSHQDFFDEDRTILTLSGVRAVHFPCSSVKDLEERPGDMYKMHLRSDEASIWHGVTVLEDGFSLQVRDFRSPTESA